MACNHTNINCGCKDSFLTTPPPCPTPENCPDPQPCSEAFDAQCISYTGDPIICGQDVIVPSNTPVSTALNSVTDYFCDAIANLEFPEVIVEEGEGISVTSTTVDNTTTYTVSLSDPLPVVPPTLAYGLYAQTANSLTVVDPNTATIIGAGVGALSVPANTFNIGDSFRVRMGGHLTCTNTQLLTINVYANASLLASTGAIDLKTTTNKHWIFDVDFTIRSLGVTGSIVSLGQFSYIPNPAGQAFEGSDFSVVSTLNTTILNTLDISVVWANNEAGVNSIYSEFFTLTKTY